MQENGIREFLGSDWTQTQDLMRQALESEIEVLNIIDQQILSRAGKQLRPIISLLVSRLCNEGKCSYDSYLVAVAVELLHNATLLHDDVADNGIFRRGHHTLCFKKGPTVSVLVGDYWLSKSVAQIIKTKNFKQITRVFAKSLEDLALGEMLQLQKSQNVDTDFQDYEKIIYYKTTSLFEVSCICGALSVDAAGQQIENVRQFAYYLGQAFQIRDDIFDYSPQIDAGKQAGSDLIEKKVTLPLLGAFSNAGKDKERQIREKIKNISPADVQAIVSFVVEYGGIEYSQKIIAQYVDKSISSLVVFPPCKEKDFLVQIARFVGERQY